MVKKKGQTEAEANACPKCGCPKDYHRDGIRSACVMADAGGGNCGCTHYSRWKEEIVHIAPNKAAPALCGVEKGRAVWDPNVAVLVIDRYCLRCYKKWEKSESSNLRG